MVDELDGALLHNSGLDEIVTDSTGKEIKARIKRGDQLIPKTSFKPVADPSKLFGLQVDSADYLRENMRYVYEDLLRIFVAAKTPIFLWGPPGAGKTRSVEAMAEDMDEHGVNYQVITVQPSTQDATVMHGLMTITEDPRTGTKIMERSVPEIAEQVWDYFNNEDGLTIMFLDEMTTCIPAQQNAMLGLLTHGKYGSLDISPYTTFVCAANPPGTVQTVLPLSEAVINRGGHIPWYSSHEHWYKKWKTGFGNPAKEPREDTKDFIKQLILSDPDVVFRDDPDLHEDADDGWSVDALCPYDQMLSSERAFTEVAKVYEVLTETFKDAPFEVAKLYLQEGVRAMVGNRWGRNSGVVFENMSSRISTKPCIEAVNRYGINHTSTLEEIYQHVGDSLHRKMGKHMVAIDEREMVDKFSEEVFAHGDFSMSKYTAFWVWLVTLEDESLRSAVMNKAFTIFHKAAREHSHEYPENQLFPGFVPETIRQEMKQAGQNLKQARR